MATTWACGGPAGRSRFADAGPRSIGEATPPVPNAVSSSRTSADARRDQQGCRPARPSNPGAHQLAFSRTIGKPLSFGLGHPRHGTEVSCAFKSLAASGSKRKRAVRVKRPVPAGRRGGGSHSHPCPVLSALVIVGAGCPRHNRGVLAVLSGRSGPPLSSLPGAADAERRAASRPRRRPPLRAHRRARSRRPSTSAREKRSRSSARTGPASRRCSPSSPAPSNPVKAKRRPQTGARGARRSVGSPSGRRTMRGSRRARTSSSSRASRALPMPPRRPTASFGCWSSRTTVGRPPACPSGISSA